MQGTPLPERSVPPEMLSHYAAGSEEDRLASGPNRVELARTQELIGRFLSPPPAVVYDVGGGAGVHALWLARQGYEVHLVEPVPLHVAQARRASDLQPAAPLASCALGDAQHLDRADDSVDLVLLLGPRTGGAQTRGRPRAVARIASGRDADARA